jgi:miniconductance mechanosensitive channel
MTCGSWQARRAGVEAVLIDTIYRWLAARGLSGPGLPLLADVIGVFCLFAAMWLVHWVAQALILRVVSRVVRHTASPWDDVLLRCGVFTRLSHIAPALVLTGFQSRFFARQEAWLDVMQVAINVYLAVIVLLVIDAVFKAVVELYDMKSSTRRVPLKGFMQGAQLVLFLAGGVFILSIVLGRSPRYLLSGLGALTAVLLLVFRDALLGLVAGIQISVNRMVQVGDWIELPSLGADGDIIDVGLTTTKVQNWDNSITTIPTHALTSGPVKNWRSMHESGGRRIQRAIYLDMQSFRFVDETLMDKLLGFSRLRPYLEQKRRELEQYNQREEQDLSVAVNGRRLTNIGCFRAYVGAYLRAHPRIHQDMPILVRQRQPSDKGLPLELYVFSNDTSWTAYEGVQADIFDHLLTIVPEFELRVYQSPTGSDFQPMLRARPALTAAEDEVPGSGAQPSRPSHSG